MKLVEPTPRQLFYEEQTYGPACFVCRRRIRRDERGQWVHTAPMRREHEIQTREVLVTGRFRTVCECGWTGEWTTSLDDAHTEFDLHVETCDGGAF